MKIKNKIIPSLLVCTIGMYTTPVFAFTKDETVYTKINQEGKSYQTTVSTHIKNSQELEIINDMTDLLNIENTKGEEEFTQDGKSLVWKADKKDIYYQGESQKELPIECNITYKLDEKEIKADEIVGKTGHVKITIQYINKEEHMVSVNGKMQKMYTPFVAVAGTVIKNDVNKNIEISNGKVIDDGSKTIVMGIALPGLQESLNMKQTEMEIPSCIEITMDAKDFEMGNIITFVTPKVIEEEDLDIFNQLDEIYKQANTLEQASSQIQGGSVALATGTSQLVSGTKELNEGTKVAYDGAKQIKSEVSKATNQLAKDQKDALDSNTLNTIAEQAKQAASLSETQKTAIGTQAQEVAKQTIESQKIAIGEKASNQVKNLTLTEVQKQQIASSVKVTLENNKNYQAIPTEELKQMVLQFSQQSAITAAETTARETAKQVAINTAQKVAEEIGESVANTTAQMVAQTTATQTAQTTAVTTAKQVANQVKAQAQNQVVAQMSALEEGLTQLTTGLGSLKDGSSLLQNGASDLEQGANALTEGIKTFHEEGIKKICDYINGDLKDKNERIEKLVELSKEYNSFTMLNNEDEGNVKFIMIMDAIKKQEDTDKTKEDIVLKTEENMKKKEDN